MHLPDRLLALTLVSALALALPAAAQQVDTLSDLRVPGGPPPQEAVDPTGGGPAAPQHFDWWRAEPVAETTPWGQAVDVRATEWMRSWTTSPEFTNPMVDHLPVAPGVVSPADHFGYPIGRPGQLHRTDEIHAYHQALAASSQRVEFQRLGDTEEGNHLALVKIGSEANLARLERVRQGMNALADPRGTSREEAERLIGELPVLHLIYSGLHSPETGHPEVTMELAYRLAASEDPMIREIRENVVVLLIPVVEPDGRNRVVDWYRKHATEIYDYDERIPGPPFWGKYIRHDNNRDGLQLIARLTQESLGVFMDWKPPITLDLHESIPFLYVSTGTGPYNPNVDPVTVSEWQWIANHEVTALTAAGMPGVWTHGFYDGWNPSYLFWHANNRNAIGRFYETFGNSIPNTVTRTLGQNFTSVQWYRPNPPYAESVWSLRNNVNFAQSGVLQSLHLYAQNRERILRNFWIKSNNALERGRTEAPYAYVVPAAQERRANVAHMLNNLRRQGIEVHRATARGSYGDVPVAAGDFIVRMDQPYRDFVQTLLGVQRFPEDAPRPYDDVGWTFGYLYNIDVHAVDDPAVQQLGMEMAADSIHLPGSVQAGRGTAWYAVVPDASNETLRARFELGQTPVYAAREEIAIRGRTIAPGAWLIPADRIERGRIDQWVTSHGFDVVGLTDRQVQGVERHRTTLPRIALLHSWRNTQDDGWVRYNLDRMGIPYEYFPEDRLAGTDLRARFDVVLFPEQGRGSSGRAIFEGLDPEQGPLPWRPHPDFPALGQFSQTDDMTGGMGYEGLASLRRFVERGGTFITLGSATNLPVELAMVRGVSLAQPDGLFVPGSIVQGQVERRASPIAFGYSGSLPLINRFGPYLNVSRALRDNVVFRYGAEEDLFMSGLVIEPGQLAGRPAVVSVPVGEGHMVLFGFNPLHRYQTHGLFAMVWNSIIHWDRLGAGVEGGADPTAGR
jgi:hypothetical protein